MSARKIHAITASNAMRKFFVPYKEITGNNNQPISRMALDLTTARRSPLVVEVHKISAVCARSGAVKAQVHIVPLETTSAEKARKKTFMPDRASSSAWRR